MINLNLSDSMKFIQQLKYSDASICVKMGDDSVKDYKLNSVLYEDHKIITKLLCIIVL